MAGTIDKASVAPRRTASRAPSEKRAEPRTDTPPPAFGTPVTNEYQAIAAAAKINGWVLIRTTEAPDGGHRYVYANDLSTNLASRPALVVITTDTEGRVLHARRDVARRTFTDQRERGDTHSFDFADAVFRVSQ